MFWSSIWPLCWLRARRAPVSRKVSSARLAVETLEDRVVPSTMSYDLWRAQTFKVDDVKVANVSPPTAAATGTVPQNASFGAMIGLPNVFGNYSYRGDGYSVAVIDTGIDYRNTNLGGGFGAGNKVVAGWDFVNNDADPLDDNGHGTHVAGIIGSTSTTYSGVAPNVNLIALKVLDKSGSGSFGNVEKALQWVITNQSKYNIVAINLSLGSGNYTTNPYTFMDDEFSSLRNKGVFLAVAAGNSFYSNSGTPGLDFPAISSYVASVGAVWDGNFGAVAWGSGARDNTTAVDRIASFSQRSSALSIMAPGAMITSTYLNNTTQAMAGTSMATPVVAGAAVILHQALDARGMTANQSTILSLMKNTGVTVVDGDDENDNVTNTGLSFKRLNLGAALDSLGKPANSAPMLQPISNKTMPPGGSVQVALSASDPDGNPVIYSANVVGASANQAYQLDQQLGLQYPGSYYTNSQGQNEKWMTTASNTWYCLLPNGELRRWTGSMTTTLQPANLVATLDPTIYADPSLLWDAQNAGTTLNVSISGSTLVVQAPSNATGSYQIRVTASDGSLSSTQTFTVQVKYNTAPTLAAVSSQSLLTNRNQTIVVSATDAQSDAITITARILGTFASPPASLVLNGNQVTIHTSPDYVGSFDVQVTASDGALSSSTTFRVTTSAASVAQRFSADFDGNGVKDTAFFNTDGSWWVSLKQTDGSFVNRKWATWTPASNWNLIQIGDFNGDAKTDIVGFGNDGTWQIGASTGSAAATGVWTKWDAPTFWRLVQVTDFNRDGKTDIVGFSVNGAWIIGQSTGAALTTRVLARWDAAQYWRKVELGDVNADGRLDLIGFSTNGTWWAGVSSATSVTTQLWATWSATSWNYSQTGDFNGDGRVDIMGFNAQGNVVVGISTGARYNTTTWATWSTTKTWTSFNVADVNRDGLDDFFGKDNAGKWYVAYSTGAGFRTEAWTGTNSPK